MANVIKHKRGSGSDPGASDLVVGEVAIRTDVGKLFTKMDNGSVAEIAGGGSDIAINTLSSSSATGGGSATFNGSAYRFTLSQPPSVSAQQLLVSINGVIQKPVAGTGQPSEGFSVDGTDIILGDAPATGADFFILTFKSLGVSEPADNSVTSAKIADGAIVNADINASAAIAGSKINPSFTSSIGVTKNNPNIRFDDSDTNNNGEITLDNTQLRIEVDEDNAVGSSAIKFRVDGSDKAVIDSSGNVGIGTTSPGSLLHLSALGASDEPSLRIFAENSRIFLRAAGSSGSFPTGGGGDDGELLFLGGDFRLGIGTASKDLIFVNGSGYTERMRIDSSGNVGIGTTSPISNSGYGGFSLNGSSGSIASLMHNGTEKLRLFGHTNPSIQYAGNLTFFSGVSGGTQRMLIKSDGRVAINTAITANEADEHGGFVSMKPTHNFDNNASNLATSATQSTLRVRTSSNSSMSLYIGGLDDSVDSARPYLQVGNLSGASGATAFYDLYLCPFGGIVRTRQVMPRSDNLYDLGSSGNRWDDVFATNGTINTSDRNEKNTIVDSDLGLSFINKLKPVSYKFNDRTRTHYGLIAQDIETVLSDISKSTTDFAGFIKSELSDTLYTEDEPLPTGKNVGDVKTPGGTNYGLRYGEFIAPLIKAVQELSAKVEALEAG